MSRENQEMSKRLIAVFDNIMHLEHVSILDGLEGKLSLSEIHTIVAIGSEDFSSMSQVAGMLKITVGTLTVAINNLVKKGYVERHRCEQDRRIVKLGLTQTGNEVCRVHREFHRRLAEAMTQGFSERERQTVNQAIDNLGDFIEQGYRGLKIMDQ